MLPCTVFRVLCREILTAIQTMWLAFRNFSAVLLSDNLINKSQIHFSLISTRSREMWSNPLSTWKTLWDTSGSTSIFLSIWIALATEKLGRCNWFWLVSGSEVVYSCLVWFCYTKRKVFETGYSSRNKTAFISHRLDFNKF